ncbi:presenilin-associated rhomboid-like protein, mitochondrial [Liolophura sinensis]|uniref:presenilin-associated rhomboid-like protein, mitochondrial n=1 Tax=Liolophura sinensis TaxID=3198878 RepID=UPI0031589EF6
MATLTCVLGRLGTRNLHSTLRTTVHEVSQTSAQVTSVRKLYTPCKNCGHLLTAQKPRFNQKTVYYKSVRCFKQKTERGQGLTLRSKVQEPVNRDGGPASLVRPFLFTTAVCCGSFSGAMIWQYETMRYHAKKLFKGMQAQKNEAFHVRKFGFREHIGGMWNNFSNGQKMVCGIIGLNFLVFIMWRVPALAPIMERYFCSSPVSGAPCLSMVLSMFSHVNFWHLAANMYVLWSFSSVGLNLLGKEQFLALYLSAGTFSCFTSYALKVARRSFTPSLGASGALMAVLGAVCLSYPDARLAIAFIGDLFPHSFSADSAMKALIAFDTTGLVLGWRLFDHAAHLGGILFGLWYIKFGRDLIWGNREPVMEAWHKLRGKP